MEVTPLAPPLAPFLPGYLEPKLAVAFWWLDLLCQHLLNLTCILRPPCWALQVPSLTWDSKLAASAMAWAGTCHFAVSGTPGVGENLGFGYPAFNDTVKGWYQQVRPAAFQSVEQAHA